MVFFYVLAAVAATLIIRDGWRRGARARGLILPAILLLPACNDSVEIDGCGNLPCPGVEAGTGGSVVADAAVDAAPDAPPPQCYAQDPDCPTFPHAIVCRPTPENACGLRGCEAGWEDCDQQPQTGCEVDVTSDPGNCGVCFHACSAGASCVSGVCK